MQVKTCYNIKHVWDELYVGAENVSLKEWFQQKWVLLSLSIMMTVLIVFIVVSSFLYYDIQGGQGEQQQTYIDIALETAPIEQVETDYVYHGDEAYTVVLGQSEEESLYVFVPQKDSLNPDDVSWTSANDVMSKEEIRNKWQQSCSNCDLLSITPGMMNGRYIWELIYEENDSMVFRTYTFEEGDVYDSISFSQN